MRRRQAFPLTLAILAAAGSLALLGRFSQGDLQQPPPREPASYRSVVKKVLPAVVSIDVRRRTAPTASPPLPGGPGVDPDAVLPEEFQRFFREFQGEPQRKPPLPAKGFGSGFVIDPSGVVVTSYHVVREAQTAIVTTNDGHRFAAKAIRTDPRTDVAILLLPIQGQKLPHLNFGDSDAMEIGDRVLAVGAPFRLVGSVTHGIISGKGRTGLKLNVYEDFLQTDAAINPGNSGGPLVNLRGEVVGINAAIKSRTGGFNGVGLAVASNLAKYVVESLRKHGKVRRGYAGMQVLPLDVTVRDRLGLPANAGVIVSVVYADTPAQKAGIRAGDILLRAGNRLITSPRQLQVLVARSPIGKKVDFEVLRDGMKRRIAVEIAELPEQVDTSVPVPQQPPAVGTRIASIGAVIADLTPELAERIGFDRTTRGVVVTQVEPASTADVGGLEAGMLILAVNGKAVATTRELLDRLDRESLAEGVLLRVRSVTAGVRLLFLRHR